MMHSPYRNYYRSKIGLRRGWSWISTVVLGVYWMALNSLQASPSPDFSREVRPILSQHCFKCHGPDKQEGGMRLDQRDSAIGKAESEAIPIVPRDPQASELLRRVTSRDESEVMPPRDGAMKRLTEDQIETLRRWIADGAEYKTHWAYVAPIKLSVPENKNAIDYFVKQRLDSLFSRESSNAEPQEHGLVNALDRSSTLPRLTASPPAPLATLCRRLYFDLIGLPPSPSDVDTFIKAAQSDRASAVKHLVDELLASPRFGEKWARHWLDLARYGDSAGYQHDDNMPLWLYRDWVIRAFNADMPFDQFTVEQIAGDLLPTATLDQRIATGFHRGATATLGADQNAEELRAQIIWDRVNTVGTTWLATSLECAQCHTHKFDPIPQSDYYRMYAYFNSTVDELTKEAGSHYFITGGILELPSSIEQQAYVAELKKKMTDEIAAMRAIEFDLDGDGGAAPLRRIFFGPDASREPERAYYYLTEELRSKGPDVLAPHIANLRKLGAELMAVLPPRSLVLEEDNREAVTRVFLRGNIRTPGEVVTPGTLSALHPLPDDAPASRLGLAKWLVSPDNPLTARVMINRWWAEIFGNGLVSTPEDFGLQGESPSHPELLDWLAVDFMENGWSMKHAIKRIVTSETYRQSSVATAEALELDAPNRWLARGPRFRLDAELIRDTLATIAGLLEHEIGGPPAFVTRADAKKRNAEFAWRRGIYLRQQRGDPYTTFASLDVPDRFACTAKRPRTNTPLQALALLNEPLFIEAAQGLAERVHRENPDATPSGRIKRMFKICTAREPKENELEILMELLQRTHDDRGGDEANWMLVANVLLNLDETITKE